LENIFTFDQKNLPQLFENKALQVMNKDNGIEAVLPGDCSNFTATTIDKFASNIKQAIDLKVKAGDYRNLEDLTKLLER
jgi:hypothetical protein